MVNFGIDLEGTLLGSMILVMNTRKGQTPCWMMGHGRIHHCVIDNYKQINTMAPNDVVDEVRYVEG